MDAILRARAKALARVPESGSARGSVLEVLKFQLGEERYAVASKYVVEVHPLVDLAPLPCTPAFLRGIVNVRGRVTPVIDIKQFFDLPDQGLTDLHRIILVRDSDLEIGLLADVVIGVTPIEADALLPTLATLTGIRAEYLLGVTADRMTVLDVARMLADSRLIVDQEVNS